VLLAIMVADCCAISVVDPAKKALALLHSGKCGSEANILGKAITEMANHFDSPPQDLIVQLSPCIRPPHYEIDFAATIRAQAADAGVPSEQIHDEQICTASDPDRFYSYRREKGLTGRMLALLGYR
ncbi:MAG: polyphenol oxidase family protein, partial [Verrucomicrobiales bacterium]